MTFDTVDLTARPRRLGSHERFATERAQGKSLLHVGAAGGVTNYLPDHPERYLHLAMAAKARETIGIDIDREGIAYAEKHGVRIAHADCQAMDLGRRFDVIVMFDVIEHVEHPGEALECLMRHLHPGGELLIATPNLTTPVLVFKALLRMSMRVYVDHVSGFMPEHLQVLCKRHGLEISELYFYTHMNRWAFLSFIKSLVNRLFCAIAPRWSNAFLVVIRKN